MFLYVCSEILCVFLISQIIQVSHIVRIVHLIIHTNLIHKFITVQKQITVFPCDLPNPVEHLFTFLIDQKIRRDRHKHRYILLSGQIQDLPVILLRLSVKRAYLIHLLHIGPHFRNRIKITSKPLPVIIVTISLVFQEILPAELPVSGVILRIFQKILCPLTLRCADLNRLNLILRPLQPKIVFYDPAALLIIRIIEQHITFQNDQLRFLGLQRLFQIIVCIPGRLPGTAQYIGCHSIFIPQCPRINIFKRMAAA